MQVDLLSFRLPLGIPAVLLPKIELVKLRSIDFFPPNPSPELLSETEAICLGTKTRTIGDALALTPLPAKLKRLYPKLKVYVYPRAFNPVVFRGNPFVDGVEYLPRALYGDDNCRDSGQLIQLKESALGVPVSESPKPEIHLTRGERAWAENYLVRHSKSHKPLCLLHPWGHTWQSVAPKSLWEQITRRWSHRYRFWQVGIEGHEPIVGCEHHLLLPRPHRHARKLFAITSRANVFVGVNSGPMHVARAFELPSLILTDEGDVADIFARRSAYPYFLKENYKRAFLYEQNTHLSVSGSVPSEEAASEVDRFLSPLPGA